MSAEVAASGNTLIHLAYAAMLANAGRRVTSSARSAWWMHIPDRPIAPLRSAAGGSALGFGVGVAEQVDGNSGSSLRLERSEMFTKVVRCASADLPR